MLDYRLTEQELAELRQAHRQTRNVREAYRLNVVILLGRGRTDADVADALLIDPDTVRDYFKRFKRGGLDELLRMNFVGSEARTRRAVRPHRSTTSSRADQVWTSPLAVRASRPPRAAVADAAPDPGGGRHPSPPCQS